MKKLKFSIQISDFHICCIIRWCFVFTFCTFSSNGYSQSKLDDLKYFDNDSIKYNFILSTPSLTPGTLNKPGLYFININMPNEIRKRLLLMDSSFWMSHLTNANSD